MIKQICEAEKRNLERIRNFELLPHRYKKIGIVLSVLSFVALIIVALMAKEMEGLIIFLKDMVLLSMLLVSISKDEIEDELTLKLRLQAFMMSFIFAVIYAIVQPLVNYGVTMLISDSVEYDSMNVFAVLWFMLAIHIGFYHLLRRFR